MAGTREIKRRIKANKNTKKITRAMQMVSAVKMRKAQASAVASRPYAEYASEIAVNLAHRIDPKFNPLLRPASPDAKVGILLVTTNRGLVGGFNSNLLHEVNGYIRQKDSNSAGAEHIAEIISYGKKGRDAMIRIQRTIAADFPKKDSLVPLTEIMPIAKIAADEFIKGNYGEIIIAYNSFVSTLIQKPVIRKILPFKSRSAEDLPEHYKKYNYEYLFEPNPREVLRYLLPRIVESEIYHAVLESDAAEHSARMIMMKNATDAASELIDDLTLTYNKIRQANITQELAEIIAGMQ